MSFKSTNILLILLALTGFITALFSEASITNILLTIIVIVIVNELK